MTASPTGGIAQIEVGLAADFMKKRLAELPGKPSEPRSVTIFHLPGWFHEINKELCEPKLVAIGPYHHNKKGLRTMEEHKWYTLRDFLARNKNVGLEVYLQVMKSIEEQARHCYSETVDMESDDFVMMLLLDGCFILQWLFKRDLYEDDAICEVGWAGDYILSDMCLFENQLPFFVIHKLLETRDQSVGWSQNCEDHCPLLKLTIKGLDGHFRIDKFRLPGQISCRDIDHWLHLYYIGVVFNFQPEAQREPGNPVNGKSHNFFGLGSFPWSKLFFKPRKGISDCSEPSDANLRAKGIKVSLMKQINIPCVAELHDAGIKFKRKKTPHNMLDISFKNGTIEMPYLLIDNIEIRNLWNMVAFEQSCGTSDFPQTLSSYLALMDSLINTEMDVAILEQSGIVNNFFQNAEEAATVFNQFAKNFVLDHSNHYFLDFFKDVRRYSESRWHKYRARLMHDYFSNPWSIISVVAAGILLILTLVQTYYSAAK